MAADELRLAYSRQSHLNVFTAGFNIPTIHQQLLNVDPGPEGPAPHLRAHSLGHVDVAGDVRQALQLAGELLQLRNAVPHTSSVTDHLSLCMHIVSLPSGLLAASEDVGQRSAPRDNP